MAASSPTRSCSCRAAKLPDARGGEYFQLLEFTWWAGWRVLGCLVLPALVLLAMRERVRDYGLSFAGLREHAWIYG